MTSRHADNIQDFIHSLVSHCSSLFTFPNLSLLVLEGWYALHCSLLALQVPLDHWWWHSCPVRVRTAWYWSARPTWDITRPARPHHHHHTPSLISRLTTIIFILTHSWYVCTLVAGGSHRLAWVIWSLHGPEIQSNIFHQIHTLHPLSTVLLKLTSYNVTGWNNIF